MNNHFEANQNQNVQWLKIYPDQYIYNDMIARLGINGITVQHIPHVNDLSRFENSILPYGLIFCYPDSRRSGPGDDDDSNVDNIVFFKHLSENACPTVALLNILCNLDIEKGALLDNLLGVTANVTSTRGGTVVELGDIIKDIHNRYHIDEPEEELAQSDSSSSIDSELRSQKVVSYIYNNGAIWKLDSQKNRPIMVRRVYGNWILAMREILQRNRKHFHIYALTRNPLVEREGLLISTTDRLDNSQDILHNRELLVLPPLPVNEQHELSRPNSPVQDQEIQYELPRLRATISTINNQARMSRDNFTARMRRSNNGENAEPSNPNKKPPTSWWLRGKEIPAPTMNSRRSRCIAAEATVALLESNVETTTTTQVQIRRGRKPRQEKEAPGKVTKANKGKAKNTKKPASSKKKGPRGSTSCNTEIVSIRRTRDNDNDQNERHLAVRRRYNLRC